jgi:hypothetical protein
VTRDPTIMLSFQVLREEVREDVKDDFRLCVWWVYSPDGQISLHGLPGGEAKVAQYAASLEAAAGRGFTPERLWQYWSEDGGSGYFTWRSGPEVIRAASQTALVRHLLYGEPLEAA